MPPGIVYDKKKEIKRNGLGITQVKSIKLSTKLDNGSANDGKKTTTQQGMIFGNTYKFKVDA